MLVSIIGETARRDLAAIPGHGKAADRPRGALARRRAPGPTALGSYTSIIQRLGEKRQALVHPGAVLIRRRVS
jgi:hypothetical protein